MIDISNRITIIPPRLVALKWRLKFYEFLSAIRYYHLYLFAATAIIVWGVFVLLGAQFYLPKSAAISYNSETCFYNPVFLPQSVKASASQSYSAKIIPRISIRNYPILSTSTCITPNKAPKQQSVEKLSLNVLGVSFLKKPIEIRSDAYPVATSLLESGGKISAKGTLIFSLNKTDTFFEYRIATNKKESTCTIVEDQINCELAPLQLTQAQDYTITLNRYFKNAFVGSVVSQEITSIEPMVISTSTIAANAYIYNSPTEILLELTKPILKVSDVTLEQVTGSTPTATAHSIEVNGNQLKVKFSKALTRNAEFALKIGEIEGTDHSFLIQPYVLPFKTSGGPKVTNISIASYKVARNAAFTVTFDVGLLPGQIASNFVSLVVNNQPTPITASLVGRTLSVSSTSTLPSCTAFNVKILDGLTSEFGIGGGPAWNFSSRTICQTAFSIGNSVQGRSIMAYRFGTGSSTILYVGGTHGNEKSSSILLNQWVDALEASPQKIPANRAIVVIPTLNPDGYALSSRINANKVDLNRNFPANDWKMSVTMPDKSLSSTGGGTSPLSEPESAALAAYIVSVKPRLVLTYHATAGVVIPNDAGDSVAVAGLYDKNSNLYFSSNGQTSNIFEYDTTGSLETWLYDKQNIPALLIELWTMNSNEFAKNQSALWVTAGL